jgi:hypothetical protein
VQERGRQQQSLWAFLAIRYPINFVNIVKTSLIQVLSGFCREHPRAFFNKTRNTLKYTSENMVKNKNYQATSGVVPM